jgi:hypothetical protein
LANVSLPQGDDACSNATTGAPSARRWMKCTIASLDVGSVWGWGSENREPGTENQELRTKN